MPTEPHPSIRLSNAPWLMAPATQAVLNCLADAGFAARVVGGAVRNQLLAEPVNDIDIATPARPEQVTAAASVAGFEVVPTGLSHGTVTVIVGHQPFEVTTLRRDVETDGRHATVAFTDDWSEDAGRRDFTINALYCDATGVIHDPVGGLEDLAARRVRFIGDPEARIREDYLRILRLFRFSARYSGGVVDADGLSACIRLRLGLASLSGERVRAELLQLLSAPAAAAVVGIMTDHGFADVLTGGVVRPHRLTRLLALEREHQVMAEPIRRLGALALFVTEDAERLVLRLRLSGAERERLLDMAAHLERRAAAPLLGLDAGALAVRLYRDGAAAVRDGLLLDGIADDGSDACSQLARNLGLTRSFQRPAFPVSGRHLIELGFRPGPEIGKALSRLEDRWIRSGFELTSAQLLGSLSAD